MAPMPGEVRIRRRKDEKAMNPIWAQMINKSVIAAMKVGSHCKKADSYVEKRPGQFYKCKNCGQRFKEKGK